MKLERDRIKAKNEAIEAQMKAMQVNPTPLYSFTSFLTLCHDVFLPRG